VKVRKADGYEATREAAMAAFAKKLAAIGPPRKRAAVSQAELRPRLQHLQRTR
jgi:hypothetical protein